MADAENAARDELPDIPLWRGTKFRGRKVTGNRACVNRVMTEENAGLVGGERTTHVVVALHDLTVGEPQDGPCPRGHSEPTAEPKVAPARYTCETPDGQLLAGLRLSMKEGREPVEPWSTVTAGRFTYLASTISGPPSGTQLVVVVRSANQAYAKKLRATNGTARTFTKLPEAGMMPAAATAALDCVLGD